MRHSKGVELVILMACLVVIILLGAGLIALRSNLAIEIRRAIALTMCPFIPIAIILRIALEKVRKAQ